MNEILSVTTVVYSANFQSGRGSVYWITSAKTEETLSSTSQKKDLKKCSDDMKTKA